MNFLSDSASLLDIYNGYVIPSRTSKIKVGDLSNNHSSKLKRKMRKMVITIVIKREGCSVIYVYYMEE